jgi:hypothetical protein
LDFQSDPSISCAVEERNPEDTFNKRRREQQEEEGRKEQIPNPTALSLSLSWIACILLRGGAATS